MLNFSRRCVVSSFIIILAFLFVLRTSMYMQVPVLETPDGPVFESNAIARYGTFRFLVKSECKSEFLNLFLILLFFHAVARLKAESALYGSSLIEYVNGSSFLIIFMCATFLFSNIVYDVLVMLVICLQAHIEQWIDFSATEIDASIGRWLYPRLGFTGPYLPPVSYK